MAKNTGELKIEYRPIGKLMPYAKNARTHSPAQVDVIVKLIQENGWTNPILVDSKNGILAGHGRLLAAKQLQMRTVPVIELHGMTPAKKRAYILADNRAGELSGWNKELLSLELGDLKGMELTGFGLRDVDFMLEPTNPGPSEPGVVEPKGPSVSRKGDIWTLGRHRMACGSALDPALVDNLMDTAKAHMVFTDPPYGVSYEARGGQFETLKNDDLRRGQLYEMLHGAMNIALKHAREEAAWYIWHASATRDDFAKALRDNGLVEQGIIIWVKPGMVLNWSDYKWAHEPCFYASRQGVKPAFYGDRTETTVWRAAGAMKDGTLAAAIAGGVLLTTQDGQEIYISAKAPAGKKVRHIHVDTSVRLSASGTENEDVWEVSRDSGHGKQSPIHPTQKPVELARRAMRNSTQEGENVLDMFSGSASTLMAGEQLGRSVYALDLDPLYVDAGIRRWQDATGNHATLEGRTFDQVAKARHVQEKAPAAASKPKAKARAA